MKLHTPSLSALILLAVVLFVWVGTVASAAPGNQASKIESIRGDWSFSQIVPSSELLTPGVPIPVVAVGTMQIRSDGGLSGYGVFNTPLPPDPEDGPAENRNQRIDLAIEGQCNPVEVDDIKDVRNGLECDFNFPGFGLETTRFCVVMNRKHGRCYDELRCVTTFEPGQTVALTEFRRQQSETCD